MTVYRKCFRNTWKAMVCSPLFCIVLCVVLLLFADHLRDPGDLNLTYNFHKVLSGFPLAGLEFAVPLLLAVMVSTDFLSERKNRFLEIQTVSGSSTVARYAAKVTAYLTLGFGVSFLMTFGCFLGVLVMTGGLAGSTYGVAEAFCLTFVRWVAYAVPVVLQYVSLAMLCALLARSAVCGIAVCVFYNFLITFAPIYQTAFWRYFYQVPDSVIVYFYFWRAKCRPTAIVEVAVSDVVKSYVLIGVWFLASLTVCFFLYRRLKDR